MSRADWVEQEKEGDPGVDGTSDGPGLRGGPRRPALAANHPPPRQSTATPGPPQPTPPASVTCTQKRARTPERTTRGTGEGRAGPMGTLSSFTVPFQPVGRAQLQPPRHACRRLHVKATSVAAPPSVDVSSDVMELGKSGMCCQIAICRVVLTSASVMYAGSNRVR